MSIQPHANGQKRRRPVSFRRLRHSGEITNVRSPKMATTGRQNQGTMGGVHIGSYFCWSAASSRAPTGPCRKQRIMSTMGLPPVDRRIKSKFAAI
jgi:hypothetical protein